MKTLRTNIESKVEQFKAVKNSKSVKDMMDGEILLTTFIHYIDEKDEKKDEKDTTVISVLGADGEYHTSTSPTFIHDYLEIIDMFDGCDEEFTIIKASNVSKAGRTFVYAKLA